MSYREDYILNCQCFAPSFQLSLSPLHTLYLMGVMCEENNAKREIQNVKQYKLQEINYKLDIQSSLLPFCVGVACIFYYMYFYILLAKRISHSERMTSQIWYSHIRFRSLPSPPPPTPHPHSLKSQSCLKKYRNALKLVIISSRQHFLYQGLFFELPGIHFDKH